MSIHRIALLSMMAFAVGYSGNITHATAQTTQADKPFVMNRIGSPDPAPPFTFRMHSVKEPSPAPTFHMNKIGPTPAPQAVNCAAMETDMQKAAIAFNASCEGHVYKRRLQQCSTLSNQLLTTSQRLLPHMGVCKTWGTDQVQGNIKIARGSLRNIQIVNGSGGGSGRSYSGGQSGYDSGYSTYQRPVGLQPSYVECIGGTTDANGMKVCY